MRQMKTHACPRNSGWDRAAGLKEPGEWRVSASVHSRSWASACPLAAGIPSQPGCNHAALIPQWLSRCQSPEQGKEADSSSGAWHGAQAICSPLPPAWVAATRPQPAPAPLTSRQRALTLSLCVVNSSQYSSPSLSTVLSHAHSPSLKDAKSAAPFPGGARLVPQPQGCQAEDLGHTSLEEQVPLPGPWGRTLCQDKLEAKRLKSRDAEIDQRWGGVQGEVEGDVQTRMTQKRRCLLRCQPQGRGSLRVGERRVAA